MGIPRRYSWSLTLVWGAVRRLCKKIADYIMTLFEQGATLLNINIVNGQQILEADKDPSKYPHLGGRPPRSAWCTSLPPDFGYKWWLVVSFSHIRKRFWVWFCFSFFFFIFNKKS